MISKIEGFVKSKDVKIHYIAKFNDPKQLSILFVPGIMMPAWIWEKQVEYFAKSYNVVAMEPRSQGDTSQSFEGHYAHNMAQDIQTVVESLHLKPLVLVGWSIGVPQVLNYAAHFASKDLIGLVLVEGVVGIDPSLPFYRTMVDNWTHFQEDREDNTMKFIKSMFVQPQKEAYFEKLNETAKRTPTNTVMTLINNYMLQDFRPLLPSIQVPTLITTIDGPRLEYMRNMNSLIPHSQIEVFPSAGHALFVDQPEKFNQSLERFINTLNIRKNDSPAMSARHR